MLYYGLRYFKLPLLSCQLVYIIALNQLKVYQNSLYSFKKTMSILTIITNICKVRILFKPYSTLKDYYIKEIANAIVP